MCSAQKGQKRAPDLLVLESHGVANDHMGAGN